MLLFFSFTFTQMIYKEHVSFIYWFGIFLCFPFISCCHHNLSFVFSPPIMRRCCRFNGNCETVFLFFLTWNQYCLDSWLWQYLDVHSGVIGRYHRHSGIFPALHDDNVNWAECVLTSFYDLTHISRQHKSMPPLSFTISIKKHKHASAITLVDVCHPFFPVHFPEVFPVSILRHVS